MGLLAGLSACSPKITPQSGEWSGSPPEAELKNVSFKTIHQVPLAKNSLILESQQKEDFIVDGGYRKSSVLPEQTEWTRSTWIKAEDLQKEKKWPQWKAQLENGLQTFFAKNPGYKSWKMISTPEFHVRAGRGLHPYALIALESKKNEIWEISLGLQGLVEKAELAGSHFESRMKASIEAAAWVFPQGPKRSDLQKVLLNSLTSITPVSNEHVSMDSQGPERLQGIGPFHFELSDPRSDELHAFYFINQFYSWLEAHWKVSQPFHVGVLTHMGYPEKTNAAFYYQNLIRLGSGDDETFSRLALDPTIVIHESCHGIIETVAHLPYQGEGGSVNEGFADTMTTLYLGSPFLGDSSFLKGPYKRAVNTPLPMSKKNGGLYHDSLIVSGFFWQLKDKIGPEKTWTIVLLTLSRLMPNSTLNDFSKQLTRVTAERLQGADLVAAESLMKGLELL